MNWIVDSGCFLELTSFGCLVLLAIDWLIVVVSDSGDFCFVGFVRFRFLKGVHRLVGIGVDLSDVFVANELYEVVDRAAFVGLAE